MPGTCRKGIDIFENPVVRRKAALESAGLTATYVGKKLGVAPCGVTLEINGRRTSYMIRAAITYMTQQNHGWLWGAPAEPPTEEQAKRLRARLGVRFCSRDQARPYKLVTQCFNCAHYAKCVEAAQ